MVTQEMEIAKETITVHYTKQLLSSSSVYNIFEGVSNSLINAPHSSPG